MTDDRFVRWVESYRSAWESNDPAEIGALFTDDALYFTEPYAAPWQGRDEIVHRWIEAKDEPGTTTFQYDVAMTSGDTAMVRGTTYYKPDRDYSNMWEVTLEADGRCSRFVEWWMKHE